MEENESLLEARAEAREATYQFQQETRETRERLFNFLELGEEDRMQYHNRTLEELESEEDVTAEWKEQIRQAKEAEEKESEGAQKAPEYFDE